MRILKYAALAAVIGLAACASTSGGGSVSLDAEKALTAAHALHDATVLTATAAFKSKVCAGTCEAAVTAKLDQAEKLLVDADGLSDPTNIAADVAAAVALITDAKGLVQ